MLVLIPAPCDPQLMVPTPFSESFSVHLPTSLTSADHPGCCVPAAPAEELEAPLLDGVRLLALDSHEDSQAWSPPPGFVVMYDPDIAFIRQLEVCLLLDYVP